MWRRSFRRQQRCCGRSAATPGSAWPPPSQPTTSEGAILVGLCSDLLTLGNWSLAVCLAGTFTILAGQLTRLDPLITSLAVVPALAVALLGGCRSYGAVAVAGGLVPGMGASELTNLTADHTWVPQVGWQRGLPLLVILGVMLLRGHPLPEGGHCWRPGLPQRCAPRTRRRWRCCRHRGPAWCS